MNKKYIVDYTSKFKKQYKKISKQNKKLEILNKVINTLIQGDELDPIYKNHKLIDNKKYKNCYECHLQSDWLLIYQILNDELILLLFATGSHTELFD